MKSIDSLNYWSVDAINYPAYQPLFDDLKDHIGVLTVHEANQLARYMDVFRDRDIVWMSYPSDPLDSTITVDRNGGEDGEYRWSGLMHYLIEVHRVDPPMEFREHVMRQLTTGVDLEAIASELRRQPNVIDAKAQNRRRPIPSSAIREREWRRLKEKGGIAVAWALYP